MLLSDGNDTTGSGQTEAALAAARGIQVQTHLTGLNGADEVLVERLTSPSTARIGEQVQVSADVTSTVANQTQFSFAASAYDVLAAWQVLSVHPEIDASRIGAQGHSRGGSAVLTAATRRFADAVVGAGAGFRSVLAAYPWSGHQFLDPSVDETEIRVIMGDADEWCSPMQVQGHCQAIRLSGGRVSMRLIGGAQHSFDRGTEIENVADASVSPAAPTIYIGNDGAFIHPLGGVADSKLVDRDLMIYALKAGYGRKGAKIGSRDGEAELFKADMLAFWRRTLG